MSQPASIAFFTAPTAFRAIRKEDPDGKLLAKYDLSNFRTLFLAGERADQIKKRGQEDGLARRQDLGRHHGGDRVGRVVKAVDILEREGREQNEQEQGHSGGQGDATRYECFKTICTTMLPALRQRSTACSTIW